jgi:dihydrolipoamide dehydrogenase
MVEKISKTKNGVTVALKGKEAIQADLALVAVGRAMNTSDIDLGKAGLTTTPQGFIEVNEHMQTAVPHIYAIGDITGKWLLAHVASHQGIVAVDHALGHRARMHYEAIPSVTYTHPEVATCGLSYEDAIEKGIKAKKGAFPFQALGKSQATGETEGFAQVITDSSTGQIIGAQVVGDQASSLIAEMAIAINNELTDACIAETVHAHPTLAEAWLEATLGTMEGSIHLPKKGK